MSKDTFRLPAPPMGWNSYCTVNCEPSEKLMLDAADALVDRGLRDAGYVYVNLDDGWLEKGRDLHGNLVARSDRFPHGMKCLTDYIHARKLKAGTYLGCGITTWNGDAGSLGHEYEDARKIAEWGFDYLKYDRHPTDDDPPRELYSEYIRMGLALRESGRDIVYSMCEHGHTKHWLWAHGCANLWRIGTDVRDCFYDETGKIADADLLTIMDSYIACTAPLSYKGCYNDPDMLVVGNEKQNDWMGPGMNETEYRSNFAIWCISGSPLLIGANVCAMKEKYVNILKTRQLIEINQDPLSLPARRVATEKFGRDLWVRPLSAFRWAVAILNRDGAESHEYGFFWDDLNLSPEVPMNITDAWTGDLVAEKQKAGYSCGVAPHETRVFILEPKL